MLDVFLDALKDSAITLGVVFAFYFLFSFIEGWVSKKFEQNSRLSPLFGGLIGLIPQCGGPVIAADLYTRKRISMGTLIAVFIACSDEALPIMISDPSKALMIFPLLGIKLVYGVLMGYIVDLIHKPRLLKNEEIAKDQEEHSHDTHVGCCGHDIDDGEKESFVHEHLIHPILHSLKIFAYVFVVNLAFGFIIYGVGEDKFQAFLTTNKYLAPLFATVIGMIPNCASSVILTEMYLMNSLSFAAAVAGLCMNAGLGMMVLIKSKSHWKESLAVVLIMFASSLLIGYVIGFIYKF